MIGLGAVLGALLATGAMFPPSEYSRKHSAMILAWFFAGAMWALGVAAAIAQQPSPEQRLVTDYNGLAGSLQAASAAFDHMKDGTRAILEQAAKDTAELRYWREYFAGTRLHKD